MESGSLENRYSTTHFYFDYHLDNEHKLTYQSDWGSGFEVEELKKVNKALEAVKKKK